MKCKYKKARIESSYQKVLVTIIIIIIIIMGAS